MGNRRNITGRLSASNQYYSKKKRKKLGPVGKGLLVVITLLVVSLFIYEVNNYLTSSNAPPINVKTTPAQPLSQEEQLMQQYQELLKRGQKYTDTERADSIKSAAIKMIEQEEKNNQVNQSVQQRPVNNRKTPTATARKPQQTPASSTNNTTTKAETTTTNTPVVISTTPSRGNEPVEEVYYPAQSISGTITSAADGTGLSGVNVMVKGGSRSTVTDYKGAYSINLAAGPGPRVLQFNYQGNRIERDIRPGRNTIDAKF
ncbi:MAG: carboxypeptidase-like regulatory domain-containing protein [Cyclobacteriaceae bacterium]